MIDILVEIIKHLPGVHSQKKHGSITIQSYRPLSTPEKVRMLTSVVMALDEAGISSERAMISGVPTVSVGDYRVIAHDLQSKTGEVKTCMTISRVEGYVVKNGEPVPAITRNLVNVYDAEQAVDMLSDLVSSDIPTQEARIMLGMGGHLAAGSRFNTTSFLRSTEKLLTGPAGPAIIRLSVAGAFALTALAARAVSHIGNKRSQKATKVLEYQKELATLANHPALADEEHDGWRGKVAQHMQLVDKIITTKGNRRADLVPYYKSAEKLVKEGRRRQQIVFSG